MNAELIKTTIRDCDRCKGFHEDVQFTKLDHPTEIGEMTHWALCPVNGQPILLKLKAEGT